MTNYASPIQLFLTSIDVLFLHHSPLCLLLSKTSILVTIFNGEAHNETKSKVFRLYQFSHQIGKVVHVICSENSTAIVHQQTLKRYIAQTITQQHGYILKLSLSSNGLMKRFQTPNVSFVKVRSKIHHLSQHDYQPLRLFRQMYGSRWNSQLQLNVVAMVSNSTPEQLLRSRFWLFRCDSVVDTDRFVHGTVILTPPLSQNKT